MPTVTSPWSLYRDRVWSRPLPLGTGSCSPTCPRAGRLGTLARSPTSTGMTSPSRCHAFATIAPGTVADAVMCDLTLTPCPESVVTILDPDGEPLAGAQVSGIPPVDLAREGWWQSREKARFQVTGLTEHRIRVVLIHHEGRRLAASLAIRDSKPGSFVVRLRPWGTVSGRLIDLDGRPRPGIRLSYQGPWFSNRYGSMLFLPRDVATDDQGKFSFEGLVPGREYIAECRCGKQVPATVWARYICSSPER